MATHHCCLQLSVSLSRHYSHHNLWSLDLTDRSYEVWLRLVNYLHSFLTHWTWLEMQQKINTISVQQCVSGQWGRPDLYQLCLCVPECSSFIWRQGGSQAARPHSYSSNLPRTKKKRKEKKAQRSYYLQLYWHLVVENVCTWSTKHDVRAFLFWEFSIHTGPTQVELGGAQRPDAGGNSTTDQTQRLHLLTLTPFNCLNILIPNIILLDQAVLTTMACIHAHIFTYIEHVGIKYYVHWEEEVNWHFYTALFPSAQITTHFIHSHTHSHTALVFSSLLKLFIYGAHTYT